MIAGIAFAAVPRSPFGTGPARAEALAAADSTAAPPDTTAATGPAPPDTTLARPRAAATPPDSAATPPDSAAAPSDTASAHADTTSAGSFASEPPETLRFIPPPGLEPPTSEPAAPTTGATAAPGGAAPPAATTRADEPERPYGPLPKGVTEPGAKPKERTGIWGLHPAAIIAALIVVHVLVVRAVTR